MSRKIWTKTWLAPITSSTSTNTVVGLILGRITWRQTRRSGAPSTREASTSERGTPSSAARNMMKDQPTPFQMLTIQITAMPVHFCASQSVWTAWPAKIEITALASPPWAAKM